VLKDGGRGVTGGRRTKWMTASLVVAELAFTVVLLVGAGLMVRSLFTTYNVDVGIPVKDLMSMRVELSAERYSTPESRRAFFDQVEQRLAGAPGLDAVAVTTGVPPFDGGERQLEVDGQTPDAPTPWVSVVSVSPSFFATLKVSLLSGRNFEPVDAAPGIDNVVVNQRMVELYFSGVDPIGRRLRLKSRDAAFGPWQTIVGISPSIRHGSVTDFSQNAVVYLLLDRNPPSGAALLVRSTLRPSVIMSTVRGEVRAVDDDQPVLPIFTIEDQIAEASWPFRVFGALFAVFGVVALTLSAVGLYSVTAYAVSQRTSEIGLRMALGATWRQVATQVMLGGARHLAVGLTIGVAGALALSRLLRGLLLQIEPNDPVTFVTIPILLSAVALLACLLPARRAARVDPVIALRTE
jgi:predicted permease